MSVPPGFARAAACGALVLALGAVAAVPAMAAAPAASGPAVPAPSWQKYVVGPDTSDVKPTAVAASTAGVTNAEGVLGTGVATLTRTPAPAKPTWPAGTSATASSFAGANTDNGLPRSYEPSNALDGNPATFWNDNTYGAYPDSLTITSPTPVTVPGITLLSNSDGVPQDYTVDTWDGSAWHQAAAVTGSTDLQRAVSFDSPVTTTQVRITVTKDQSTGKGEYTRIAEVYPGLIEADVVPSITVDFGKVVVGYPKISFAGASGNHPGLRLAFSETKQYLTDTSDFTRSNNGDTITPGTDQIAVAAAPYSWKGAHGCADGTKVCADGLHGFRYMKISLDALAADAPDTANTGTVSMSGVSLDFTAFVGNAASYTGWFQSSDEDLNRYWYNASYTNELITDTFRKDDVDPRNSYSASLDGKLVLTDGAKRDRDPYVGDVAVSGRTAYLTHDVSIAAKNVLADLADHQRADGWIPPASISNYSLPLFDYPLWWVTSSWDYELYTGDTAYAEQYYPNLQKVLNTWYPSVTDSNGLLSKGLNGTGGYGDYAFLGRTGEVTYYNALYVQALTDASKLAAQLGHADDAQTWADRAATVSAAINAHLWDSTAAAYLDSNVGDVRHAQDGNGIAILAGVAGQQRATQALDYLSANTTLPYGNSFMDNDTLVSDGSQRVYAFTSYPEIQARFLSGQADSAIDEIKRLYGWMESQDPGVTDWEGIGANGSMYEGGFTSAAHGWSTGVLPALTNDLLGATPTGSGFSTWTVVPHPGSVTWAQGQLPTPHGPLAVSWNTAPAGQFALTVTSPAGTSGDVAVPVSDRSANVFVDGVVAWNGEASVGDFAATRGADGYVTLHAVGAGTHVVTVGAAVVVAPGGGTGGGATDPGDGSGSVGAGTGAGAGSGSGTSTIAGSGATHLAATGFDGLPLALGGFALAAAGSVLLRMRLRARLGMRSNANRGPGR
ncbi:alpha-L-rhamnosidase C-terminal domain-containing protein [Subtercola vilae]|nr:alpha-L-rhamnosidase C-terminal domain-containing protein [Subtercola vilae]